MADNDKPAAEDIAHLTLEHLKHIRASTDRTDKRVSDLHKQAIQMERQLAGIRGDIAVFQEMHADQSEKMRSIEERLDRLERHAGLTDALSQ